MKYWAVGINGDIDDGFLNKKKWSTDYPESDEEGLKHRKWIKSKISIGDMVALKTINRSNNSLKIFALGTILEKYDDYTGFKIDWIKVFPTRETKSSYGQAKTIAQVLDKNAISDIFEISLNNDIEEVNNMNIKNIILYGSPGVGKTHNIKKLISLIESRVSEKEIFETIKNNEINNGVDITSIEDRVKFITFHQSFGYEDFIEGFRPNEEGRIELEDGVFKSICNQASKNMYKSFGSDKLVFDDAFDILLKDTIEDSDVVKIDLKSKNSFYEIYDYNNKSIYYTRQGRSREEKYHTLAISTIKSMYEIEGIDVITGGLRTYYKPLLNKLLEIGSQEKVEKVERQNYYLVIDEINRGNISKIFGELITLIEEDKRDTLEVTLPYSKKPFKIPSNLYIIGAMNSTDKSIALIDIALRRRFTFLKMEPKLDLVKNEKAKSIMKELNEKITEKLGSDYVLGHSYFMKIENDDDLDFVMEYKIKPLLEEYFYGDEQGLKDVLEANAL